MKTGSEHSFHIPVMGLAYTIDSPLKVGVYGINSVVSIIEDELMEKMREVISLREHEAYQKIEDTEFDYRAKRITAYLNLLNKILTKQIANLQLQDFESSKELHLYFELLPETSVLKKMYNQMLQSEVSVKRELQEQLKGFLTAGSVDVNIMTKVDKTNYDKDGKELPANFSDALAALRGYALSDLSSSVVFSAGLNPRLYAYCEQFQDFYPDQNGVIKKKIILKVSDYRSALIQGKYLAKKGLWISEFRIESGINCGGHAFVSEGMLFGPILEEFKNKREDLKQELYKECTSALTRADRALFKEMPEIKITAQGGIGTSIENEFLLEYYNLDATGWGSPFLLVPEATTVDEETLNKLANAKQEDYYLSHASPLGVPFNNFRKSSSEAQRLLRISKNRPGSPCYREFLVTNKEFTERPICTASRKYQQLKLDELDKKYAASDPILKHEKDRVIEKDCLCEGLTASAFLVNKAKLSHKLSAVTICPGPNLAYFSGVFSLKQMVDHIYGRTNLLNSLPRPNLFINELQLYFNYLIEDLKKNMHDISEKKKNHYLNFKKNLQEGIQYYEVLFSKLKQSGQDLAEGNSEHLEKIKQKLDAIIFNPEPLTI